MSGRGADNEVNDDRQRRLLVLGSNQRWISEVVSALGPFVRPAPEDAVRVINTLAQLARADQEESDLVLCAPRLPDGDAFEALRRVQRRREEMPFVVVGDLADRTALLRCVAAGATDFALLSDLVHQPFELLYHKWILMQRVRQDDEMMIRRVSRKLTTQGLRNRRLRELIGRLEQKVRTDELTGLHNRRWLNLALEGSWAEACRNDLPLALLMIDLDGFKRFNDALGHQEGDRVLRLVAEVIRANCREVDMVARYGGDEFCVLMPHTEPEDAAAVARRVVRQFRTAVRRYSKHGPGVDVSVGLAHIDVSRPITAEQLLTHADEAMYAAKAAGEGRVMIKQGGRVPSVAADAYRARSEVE